jgi:dTDP-4-dehydrorhamnose reductase
MKVLMLGGTGLLGSEFKKISDFILSGREIDITNESELYSKLDIIRPDTILLAAAESNSVDIDNNPITALETNIKGAVNVTKYCIENNIRLIYISTDYVYDSKSDNHQEDEPLKPFNLYAWTKLGGECAVRAHKDSLIIRTSFGSMEYPYEFAYGNRFVSKDYVDVISPMIKDLVLSNEVGVINVGTNEKTLYEYAQQRNPKVKKMFQKEGQIFVMDITKLRKFYYKNINETVV